MDALNQTLALVLWSQDQDGNDDVAVFTGRLIKEGGLYYFQRKDGENPEIKLEWLSRIKKVPEELKTTLSDCDYQLSLLVGDIDDGSESLETFGLKWPK